MERLFSFRENIYKLRNFQELKQTKKELPDMNSGTGRNREAVTLSRT